MLCYAGNLLDILNDRNIGIDDYDNEIYNVLAHVFSYSLSKVIKGGFHHSYISKNETLTSLRGKIDIKESYKYLFSKQNVLACDYDEYTKNDLFNQILKFTIIKLLRNNAVEEKIKINLRQQLIFFNEIDSKPPTNDNIRRLIYNRSSANYRLLIFISKMIYDNIKPNEDDGDIIFKDFYREEHMNKVFELFLLNFYKIELDSRTYKVHAPKIPWHVSDESANLYEGIFEMEENPTERRTDIVIENKLLNLQLIFDAKYYRETFIKAYMDDSEERIRDNHINQVRGYLLDSNFEGNKIGALLYPMTVASVELRKKIDPPIIIKTINLNNEWRDLKKELLDFVYKIEIPYKN